MVQGFVVLGYAVTALHPGIGRAPGVVDLPVQRDPMGYPMVYASSIKGAFKAECGRRLNDKDNNKNCINNKGRLDCDKCPLCCCLFGHELGGESAAGLLSVLDMVPLFFPVPSLSHGYLYITTPYLAARAIAILETIGNNDLDLQGLVAFLNTAREDGSKLKESEAIGCAGIGKEVYVGTTRLEIKRNNDKSKDSGEEKKNDSLDCSMLNVVKNLGGLAADIANRLIVVSDKIGPLLVEKGLIRLTRIRLRVDTKTVTEQALWTEEYIPQGTIFLSGFIALTPRKNKYCCEALKRDSNCILASKNDVGTLLKELLNILGSDNCTTYAIIGGKETIGKGILRLSLKPCKTSKSKGDKQ